MNQKEVNELRRRFKLDRGSFGHIYGCYVNGGTKEIISCVDESLTTASQEEGEMYLALLKKTLSGALCKNLLDVPFTTAQVMDSEEHRLLMQLRASGLKDEQARQALYERIMPALDMEGSNYLILLGFDRYDVPFKGTDEGELEDASDTVFSYVVCAICPVKDASLALRYQTEEKAFRSQSTGQTVAAPAAGFVFPAFDDRAANIYHALYYAHDPADIHPELLEAVFRAQPMLSPAEQKEIFRSAVASSLEEHCSFDVVQSVHEQLRERIVEHKESHDPEPLAMSVPEVSDLLRIGGAEEPQVEAFCRECEEQFGKEALLSPGNLIDSGRFEVITPEVKITVDPDHSYLLQMRNIDGRNYILIPAENGVEVNGVSIDPEKQA